MAKPNVVNKEKLLQAAKEIIAEHGMEKLTLKAVAESAEVTQGTVYYHFKTKDQLLLEVTEAFCKASGTNRKGCTVRKGFTVCRK